MTRRRASRIARLLPPLALLALGVAGLWPDGPRGPVDWRDARVVVFESDDWGLCGFVPDAGALAEAERPLLGAGRFPPAYWLSTLEDSAAVRGLSEVLARHRGRDGLPPVLQANMIVSALELEPDAGWRRCDIPDLPSRYARPGLWEAVDAAIARGVWHPEFHGAFHYDPALRQAAAAAGGAGRWSAERGILAFPGSATAWELGDWRATRDLTEELDRSLGIFRRRFGRVPASVCAPDYVWDGRCEDLWQSRHLRVIQAKREQRDPRRRGGGAIARVAKLAARARDKLAHPERAYLERNCRFEPAQAVDPGDVVASCLAEIRRAWARGEPAVVETHRFNFVSVDTAAAATGRRQLDALLRALEADARGAPIYLVDDELAQLMRSGTSRVGRGPVIVARNLTRSLRVVSLPDSLRPGRGAGQPAAGDPAGRAGVLVPVPAGGSAVLPAAGRGPAGGGG